MLVFCRSAAHLSLAAETDRARLADAGFELRERLGIYPAYTRSGQIEQWLDPALRSKVEALMSDDGLVRPDLEGWS